MAKLPEEFAPTGPKISKFPIRPAAPVRPRLFADEARFAFRLALLAGACEYAAWAWLAGLGRRRELVALGSLRLLRPFWSRIGTRISRPAIALVLVGAATLGLIAAVGGPGRWVAIALLAAGLPALGDLCASCIGDSVTVERRASAYAWLDIAQGLGAACAVALAAWSRDWAMVAAIPMLIVGGFGIPELRDRGTPRSSWRAGEYLSVLASPLGKRLTLTAFVGGLFAGPGSSVWERHFGTILPVPGWVEALLVVAGMAIAARLDPMMRNAMWLPRAALILEGLGVFVGWPPLLGMAMGVMLVAIPAAVARGAGEMERPIASSLAWSALFLGAAVGAAV